MTTSRKLAAITLAAAVASPLHAQDEAAFVDAFKGDWYIFDPAYASGGGTCSLELDDAGQASGTYAIVPSDCVEPVGDLAGWRISNGQILLIAADGSTTAALGGNQRRITGEISGGPRRAIVMERASGDGNSARLSEAVKRHGCIFRGFTDRCIESETLVGPDFAAEGEEAIEVIVNLSVRSQPRHDAPALGVVPKGTVVTVDECIVASDGIWCSAGFGEDTGWLARTALRQDEWPIATFVPTEPSGT
ncbi:SH3 domain-containing protein [Thalassococcus profundi]|uniref:SH3 domain-containing protein n=1 Tax=Thalassococcus profundi TaxID=2282382 RepID=UPI00405900B5